jgi:hypothetical protein
MKITLLVYISSKKKKTLLVYMPHDILVELKIQLHIIYL